MHLALTPEEADFRDEMRTLFTTKIPKEIRERSAAGNLNFPDDIVTTMRILNEEGIAVPNWPVADGGKDWTPVQRHIWQDQMNLAAVPEPLAFNAAMVGPVIAQFGSQEIKDRFLPATANLDIWWCQGFSEPEAGSDLASLKTKAVRDGDHYIVNGQKTWTTLAQYADWIFCLVRTDPDAPKKQAGISFLLIDMNSEGIERRPIQLIDGGHEVNEVWFTDVRVPVENLVGEENAGWSYAKFLLSNERGGIARVSYNKIRLARAKEIAASIPTPNGSLLDDPFTRARFVELENALLALELTQLRVVASDGDGKPNPVSSVLKLRGSELTQEVTELMTDLAGTDALTVFDPALDDAEWAHLAMPTYLNTRKVSIYGGSSEVQRTIIASGILGL
ncbi:acyl-CoA dehydrogenase [Williamsia sp. Leaf354]|uniref:Acyl-CoA dehydrogenase family protein n=1 Tax=Williamsia herbipolensis TaxID=1603258 RepID=A0AAU4JZN6_9NOCA|nr:MULTISPECIES: acyl-CoA dehydrogenase family protein [Williamsia]KQS00310.1 acyl-CoA dehydrogenase [Williamsia sp. Leaf354]MCX6468440.1 acyl-CoA dehydrogenase family protein [Mycobacteriales bacterium]